MKKILPWILTLALLMIIIIVWRVKERTKNRIKKDIIKEAKETGLDATLISKYEEYVQKQMTVIAHDSELQTVIQGKANKNNITFYRQQLHHIAMQVEKDGNSMPDGTKIPQELINMYKD